MVYAGDRTDQGDVASLSGRSVQDVADYDGDGAEDLLVQDDSTGEFFILTGATGAEISLDSILDNASVVGGNGIDTLGMISDPILDVTPLDASGVEVLASTSEKAIDTGVSAEYFLDPTELVTSDASDSFAANDFAAHDMAVFGVEDILPVQPDYVSEFELM